MHLHYGVDCIATAADIATHVATAIATATTRTIANATGNATANATATSVTLAQRAKLWFHSLDAGYNHHGSLHNKLEL